MGRCRDYARAVELFLTGAAYHDPGREDGERMPLITIDRSLAAQLLRDLADRVESGDVEISGIKNNTWGSLKRGDFTVEWREKVGS